MTTAFRYRVTGSEEGVDAWSTTRLSFEPKGQMLVYREELRTALRSLQPGLGEGLLATYQSPDTAFVDVENAALYNVGASAYGHLTAKGLVCRRESSADDLHHLVYRVGPLDDPHPVMTREIARMGAPTAGVNTAGTVWTSLRPTVQVPQPAVVHDGPFTVDLEVHGDWSGRRVASLVKPVLDGLISALHIHNGTHRDALLPRLAQLGDPEQVWAQLLDPTVAVLGSRVLLRPHGQTGMAWNPADDLCTAFRVRRLPARDAALMATVRAAP